MEYPHLQTSLESMLSRVDHTVARVLDGALSGHEVTVEQGVLLFDSTGDALLSIMAAADELRRRSNGDFVSYVVNRNINFTNVCIKRCGFCAFSRDHRQEEGYFLPLNEIIRRVREAADLGATEVCVQAGLPPKMDGSLYVDLTREIKSAVPDIHLHGFSPEEVLYGAVRSRCSIPEYLTQLRDAGVGSLPGTSAEILDQVVRDRIAPGRITVDQWSEVIRSAHGIGIPTTSTIMFGHIETSLHRAAHLVFLRDIQKETHGFTEFVPLSFVHEEAPMFNVTLKGRRATDVEVRPGATGLEVIKMHAIARIMLHGWIDNIQCSWVKEGPKLAQVLLASGCNDVGGTLINESISTSAGASYGQLIPPSELRHWIRDIGRIPVQRDTFYNVLRSHEAEPERPEPLDIVRENAAELFGSFDELIKIKDWHYSGQRAPSLDGPTWPELRSRSGQTTQS